MNKRKISLIRPTPEEEAEIPAQLAEDPDTYEWTDEDWANAKTTEELFSEAAKWRRERKAAFKASPPGEHHHHPRPGDHQLVQGSDRRGRRNRRHKMDDTG